MNEREGEYNRERVREVECNRVADALVCHEFSREVCMQEKERVTQLPNPIAAFAPQMSMPSAAMLNDYWSPGVFKRTSKEIQCLLLLATIVKGCQQHFAMKDMSMI